MKFSRPAAFVGAILALPCVFLGLWGWVEASRHNYRGPYGIEASEFGDAIFFLGSPLTQIVLQFRSYAGRGLESSDDWWAMPLVVALFLLQWVIWSQLIALIFRLLKLKIKYD
jgi:hypothetical protein